MNMPFLVTVRRTEHVTYQVQAPSADAAREEFGADAAELSSSYEGDEEIISVEPETDQAPAGS